LFLLVAGVPSSLAYGCSLTDLENTWTNIVEATNTELFALVSNVSLRQEKVLAASKSVSTQSQATQNTVKRLLVHQLAALENLDGIRKRQEDIQVSMTRARHERETLRENLLAVFGQVVNLQAPVATVASQQELLGKDVQEGFAQAATDKELVQNALTTITRRLDDISRRICEISEPTRGAPSGLLLRENLALNKPATMTPNHPTGPPRHGNDGNVNTIVHSTGGGPFTHWTWTVDLGATYTVDSVLYVARTDCCPSPQGGHNRNRDTEIRVGSHATNFDAAHSARCVLLEGVFMEKGQYRLFQCERPLAGRYVRVSRPKTIIMDFSEIAVYGREPGDQPGPSACQN